MKKIIAAFFLTTIFGQVVAAETTSIERIRDGTKNRGHFFLTVGAGGRDTKEQNIAGGIKIINLGLGYDLFRSSHWEFGVKAALSTSDDIGAYEFPAYVRYQLHPGRHFSPFAAFEFGYSKILYADHSGVESGLARFGLGALYGSFSLGFNITYYTTEYYHPVYGNKPLDWGYSFDLGFFI